MTGGNMWNYLLLYIKYEYRSEEKKTWFSLSDRKLDLFNFLLRKRYFFPILNFVYFKSSP